jgi:hypothetical protein
LLAAVDGDLVHLPHVVEQALGGRAETSVLASVESVLVGSELLEEGILNRRIVSRPGHDEGCDEYDHRC